jgi:hypothetical protein
VNHSAVIYCILENRAGIIKLGTAAVLHFNAGIMKPVGNMLACKLVEQYKLR